MARPATYAHYEKADLALQAAVLAHGLAEGQLFIEGNKRSRTLQVGSVSRLSPILMKLMKAKAEKETVHFFGERLLHIREPSCQT